MHEACTLGIGGPARYFVEVYTTEQALDALKFAKEKKLSYHILGKGSNTLFDDRGYEGVIISNKIDFINEIAPGCFHVGAGYSFSLLGTQTARQKWSGLEFASGIPGSVGGAIFMNAGANQAETADILESVDFLADDGLITTYSTSDLQFAYRFSPFQKMKGLIISGTFKLASKSTARQRQLEIIDYRKNTQPYKDKSAGCIFRNPQNHSAGALIEKAGLKGVSIGDAKISEKHANFIVNVGKASCTELQSLVSFVQKTIKEQTGIQLESEVRQIPYSERVDANG